MPYTIAPAAACLLTQATAMWPDRSKASDGTIGDTSHASRASDHNPDARGIVHAADLTHDPAHGCDNNINAEHVKDDPRVKYVIWNRRIWNPSISRSWRPYTGTNPHDHHMHVSVTDTLENDTRPWFTTDQEDITIMDDDTRKYLDAKFANLAATGTSTGNAVEKIAKETKGLHDRSTLTRRIARAIAHKVGVTQPEIDSQA